MKNNDEMNAVLQELAEEAMVTGGAVWAFGPDGSEQLHPPAHRKVNTSPQCPDPDWWPPST